MIAIDNGTPALSTSQTFKVTVLEDSNINAGKAADNGSPDTFRLVKSGTTDEVFLNGTIFIPGLQDSPELYRLI